MYKHIYLPVENLSTQNPSLLLLQSNYINHDELKYNNTLQVTMTKHVKIPFYIK